MGASRRALALVVAAIVVCGSSTTFAAPGIVVSEFEAPKSLRGAAGALTILVRSHLSTQKRPGKTRAQIAAALPGVGRLVVAPGQISAVLGKTAADRLVTGVVKQDGILLAVALTIYDGSAKVVQRLVVKGAHSDVSTLAEQTASKIASALDDEVFPGTPRISIGQLRAFAIAAAGLNARDMPRVSAGARAMRRGVPVRVSAAKEIALAVVANAQASLESRILAAIAAGDLKALERLVASSAATKAHQALTAAASIHVAIARLDMAAAKQRLQRAAKLTHPLLGLARVEYAHQQGDANARARALWPLLEPTPYLPALAWIADLAPKAFSDTTERLLLKVARAIRAKHPGLASALALRAARAGGRLLLALDLVDLNELDSREIGALPSAIDQAVAAKRASAYRLRAELAARAGKIDLALDNIAKALKLDPADARANKYKAALIALKASAAKSSKPKATAIGTDLATDPKAKKTALRDDSLRALAGELQTLFEAFPELVNGRLARLVIAPLEGSHEPFYTWYQVAPDRLRDGLARALATAPYNIQVVVGHDEHPLPPRASELKALVGEHDAHGVLLYGVRAAGSRAKVKLVLFNAHNGQASESEQTIAGKSLGLVGWNSTFLAIVATLAAMLLMFVAFRIIRSKGMVQVTLEMDTAAEDEAFVLLISRSEKPPKVTNANEHETRLRQGGFTRARFQATMVGKTTKFETIPIGHWWVHVYGTYRKGNDLRQLGSEGSKKIRVKRNQTTRVAIDLVPKTTEYNIRIFDGTGPVIGASVWIDGDTKKTMKTPSSGSVQLNIAQGTHVLCVLANGMRVRKDLIVRDTKIHTLTVNLERERRLAQASEGLELGDSDGAEVEILDSSGRAVNTTKAAAVAPIQPPAIASGSEPAVPPGSAPAVSPGSAPAVPPGSAATAALPSGASSLNIGGMLGSAVASGSRPGTPKGAADSASGLQRYQATAELGRGAMGIVYKARDVTLERDVALKVMSDEIKQYPAALTMFLQEAKALAALNHSNIVTVFDQGDDNGQMFMVMEFVEGTTLEAELVKHKVLPLKRVLNLGDQICAGLAYAHAKRVIHRDIKPANIFLANDGTVKLGDFGLARVVNELRIHKTEVKGTPLYMSPEQIRGTDIDFRADLYSVGCTLFECVTGRPPFVEGEILYHHINTAPPKPSDLVANVPPALEAVIMACLAKDKEDRFRSVQAMRDALSRVRA